VDKERNRIEIWNALLDLEYLNILSISIRALQERNDWATIRSMIEILLLTVPLRTPLISMDIRHLIPVAVYDVPPPSRSGGPTSATEQSAQTNSVEQVKQALIRMYFHIPQVAEGNASPTLSAEASGLALFDVLLSLVLDTLNTDILPQLFLLLAKLCSSDFTSKLASDRGLMDAMVAFMPRGTKLLTKKIGGSHFNKDTFSQEIFMKGHSFRDSVIALIPIEDLPPTFYLLLAELARYPANRDWMYLCGLLQTLLDRCVLNCMSPTPYKNLPSCC